MSGPPLFRQLFVAALLAFWAISLSLSPADALFWLIAVGGNLTFALINKE